mmetsp:Transcript_14318/g.36343  ORF Transcript_14318/g.36343 Transcript_14318/m.36343 type:complete len:338 (-) Transcript_14318:2115-3128(-)
MVCNETWLSFKSSTHSSKDPRVISAESRWPVKGNSVTSHAVLILRRCCSSAHSPDATPEISPMKTACPSMPYFKSCSRETVVPAKYGCSTRSKTRFQCRVCMAVLPRSTITGTYARTASILSMKWRTTGSVFRRLESLEMSSWYTSTSFLSSSTLSLLKSSPFHLATDSFHTSSLCQISRLSSYWVSVSLKELSEASPSPILKVRCHSAKVSAFSEIVSSSSRTCSNFSRTTLGSISGSMKSPEYSDARMLSRSSERVAIDFSSESIHFGFLSSTAATAASNTSLKCFLASSRSSRFTSSAVGILRLEKYSSSKSYISVTARAFAVRLFDPSRICST